MTHPLPCHLSEESRRGSTFTPPLDDDQLAFYDAVAENGSARLLQGDDVLAQIARELVEMELLVPRYATPSEARLT